MHHTMDWALLSILIYVIIIGNSVEGLYDDAEGIKAHPGRKVVCYFGSWATYRVGNGRFDVEEIDPFVCTHVIFGFLGLRNGVVVPLDAYNDLCEDWGQGALKRFALLKQQNPRLKTMAAIGGWNEGSKRYSDMAATAGNRSRFIESVVQFLDRFSFDGFDLDWEYPANRGGEPKDKENFALLVKEMRKEFDNSGYILSAAVSAGAPTIQTAYDVPTLSRYLDFINIMTYDFHGHWEMVTGHHSPMYKSPLDTGLFEYFNVNNSINFWISQGASREKLVLGMGTYGRGVILDKESDNGLYAPGSQPLPPGPHTKEPGYWGYNEICELLMKEKWEVKRDKYIVSPYAYRGLYWVGYDDIESVKHKAQYIVDHGLGGGMIWSLETDDFQGICHNERFPFIKTIYRTVIGEYPAYKWEPKPARATSKEVCRKSDEIAAITESSTSVTISASIPSHEFCRENGRFYPDPNGECQKFVQCVLQVEADGAKWNVFNFTCGPGTIFSQNYQACALPNTSDPQNCSTMKFRGYIRRGPNF